MGSYLENSVAYMRKNHPSLKIEETDDSVIFEGMVYIVAQCTNPFFRIQICPKIKLSVNKDGLGIPLCVYLGKMHDYPHINKDGTLCVATDFDIMLRLQNSFCVSDYIEQFLKPFFLSFEYWKKTGKPLFGERSHGERGVIESIKEYTNSYKLSDEDVVLLLAWAADRVKFKRIIPKEKQSVFRSRYQNKIAKLRKLDGFYLWRMYESLRKIK